MTNAHEIHLNPSPKRTAQTQLRTINPLFLKTLLEKQAVHLIDVRERSEYAGEKIPGSILIPLSTFDPANLPLDDTTPIVLYCQTGNRSAKAAQKLYAVGMSQVMHLDGGLVAWKQMGYMTEVSKNAPISLMRQVQIVAGSLVVTGTLLGAFVSPWFLILSGFVGSGLVFAGATNTCALGMLLAKMPWNQ